MTLTENQSTLKLERKEIQPNKPFFPLFFEKSQGIYHTFKNKPIITPLTHD
jgi:hypothetical protein